jgi:hypothetical protein
MVCGAGAGIYLRKGLAAKMPQSKAKHFGVSAALFLANRACSEKAKVLKQKAKEAKKNKKES